MSFHRRKGARFAIVGALALALPAVALGAPREGDWKGAIKNEPGSKVKFEVKSGSKAVDFKATQMPVLCGIFPNSFLETRTVVIPKMRIDGNTIAGSKIYRDDGEVIGEVAMDGEFDGKSKVSGTIIWSDRQCSGEEEFTAKAKG